MSLTTAQEPPKRAVIYVTAAFLVASVLIFWARQDYVFERLSKTFLDEPVALAVPLVVFLSVVVTQIVASRYGGRLVVVALIAIWSLGASLFSGLPTLFLVPLYGLSVFFVGASLRSHVLKMGSSMSRALRSPPMLNS